MLRNTIMECLPDLQHYASTHGPGPDKRLAALQKVLREEADAFLISPTKPAGGGMLPQRVTLHLTGNEHMPLATHLEAQQENGRWARMQGNYFSPEEQRAAVEDYLKRCLQLRVRTLEV